MKYQIGTHLDMCGFEEKSRVVVVDYDQGNVGHGEYLVEFKSGFVGNAREEELKPCSENR